MPGTCRGVTQPRRVSAVSIRRPCAGVRHGRQFLPGKPPKPRSACGIRPCLLPQALPSRDPGGAPGRTNTWTTHPPRCTSCPVELWAMLLNIWKTLPLLTSRMVAASRPSPCVGLRGRHLVGQGPPRTRPALCASARPHECAGPRLGAPWALQPSHHPVHDSDHNAHHVRPGRAYRLQPRWDVWALPGLVGVAVRKGVGRTAKPA
mmetsp:Transcript_102835/g.286344  ORF Transcript_102835/g.286344 Transcript_102835/m.286344 type:complete len:205 (+) Transcript_102835:952-1566(+)